MTDDPSNMASVREVIEGVSPTDKPLPGFPRRRSSTAKPDTSSASQRSPSRPRLSSLQSFQRPKKSVIWRGKKCIIALPLQDREEDDLPPPLSPTDVKNRLRRWELQGFNVNGFVLGDSLDGGASDTGHSRTVFPDPSDMHKEHQQGQFQVSVPNQRDWQAWVDHINEEKLRALGVTPSVSEAPPSARSPFSKSISRTATHHSLAISPPVAASFDTSTSSPPHLSLASAHSTVAAPSRRDTQQAIPHDYQQSVPQPMMQARVSAPFDSLSPHPLSYFTSHQGHALPIPLNGVPSLREILSPVSPFAVGEIGQPYQPLAIHHQQPIPSQQMTQQHFLPNTHSSPQGTLPNTRRTEVDSLSDAEISHPTPRSHQHNLSEALQNEIEQSEGSTLYGTQNGIMSTITAQVSDARQKEDDIADHLPILKRSESLLDSVDIITNPSDEPSPVLREDRDPLAAWRPTETMPVSDPSNNHPVQSSTSKLNVQAKEFDPQGTFTRASFAFGGSTLDPPASSIRGLSFSFAGKAAPTPSSRPQFNVEAPAFKPLFQTTAPQVGSFNFSSATFNVKAPSFSPITFAEDLSNTSIKPYSNKSEQPACRIFGDVDLNASSRVTRRSKKGLTFIRPRSRNGARQSSEGGSSAESLSGEDEEGRPQAPTERLKRTRRGGSDGDRSPVFADSAPFQHMRILSEIIDNAELVAAEHAIDPPEIDTSPAARHRSISVDAAGKNDLSGDDMSASSSPDSNPWSPFTFKNKAEALDFNAARPPSSMSPVLPDHRPYDILNDADEALPVERAVDSSLLSVQSDSMTTRQENLSYDLQSSLSALAVPVDFDPNQLRHPQSTPSTIANVPNSNRPLTSRLASDRSPPTSPSSPLQNLSSPPSDLYSYIKPEHNTPLSRPVEDSLQQEQEASAGEQILLSIEHESSHLADHAGKDSNHSSDAMSISASSDIPDEAVPSYEEIDAVMKHFEQNPELSVERQPSPVRFTPLLDSQLPSHLRSDAPSPSPRKTQPHLHIPGNSTEIDLRAPRAPYGLGVAFHQLSDGDEDVSDWNETESPAQEDKIPIQAHYSDGPLNDLVDGLLKDRLEPLKKALETIQDSITAMATRPRSGNQQRIMSPDVKHSDADDEEDNDAFGGFTDYQARSPIARRKGADRLKQAVMEALSTYQPPLQQSVDVAELTAVLTEMRQLARPAAPQTQQADLKSVVEDVITNHPRLRGQRVQQNHDGGEKLKLQLDGLETLLKVANERADEESSSRRHVEDELAETRRRLRHVEEDAAQYRESAEEAERSLRASIGERQNDDDLEQTVEELNTKICALESTLEEYRMSHREWQEDLRNIKDELREEQMKKQDLERTLRNAGEQLRERSRSREALRVTVDRLREEMASLVSNVSTERSEWKRTEHSMASKQHSMQAVLEHEIKMREHAEQELAQLTKQHQADQSIRRSHALAEEEIEKFKELVAGLREDNKSHQDRAFQLERDLAYSKDSTDAETSKATIRLQTELERANAYLDDLQADSHAQIARLQKRLNNAELDLEQQKAKHEKSLQDHFDAHGQALQESQEKRESALQEQHVNHERKLNDLRERHTLALHNSSDDRYRLEYNLNEKLLLRDDKIKHLETKVADLEERLHITKSAARAAVEAATLKGINLPTPAPSTMTSPPHPSHSHVRSPDTPEKVSPQALRETILVLQDQLQFREQAIEKLEQEISQVDRDAPKKIQGLETEVGWLRELLAVRLDDIEDIINVVSEDDFDKSAARDAAVRLKANLQMEQQLRERAVTGLGLPASLSLPSIASLSNTLSQSPKALPLAAAAAWGNWRKARDSSFGALSDLATNLGDRTPSKSMVASPASFLSGMLSLPVEAPTPDPRSVAGSAARRSSGEARPLRAYNSQPRALSQRKDNERSNSGQGMRHRHPEPPATPTMKATVGDDRKSMGFGEDVDEDASPFDGRESQGL